MNVEDQGVLLPFENEEINCLKYIPERKKNKKVFPAQWYGYSRGNKKAQMLDEDFVIGNFSQEIIADVKKMGIQGDKKFIDVPPGDAKTHEVFPKYFEKGPIMKYRQKEGERTCMVYSFASALHHMGEKQVASEIYGIHKKVIERHNTIQLFSQAVREKNERF